IEGSMAGELVIARTFDAELIRTLLISDPHTARGVGFTDEIPLPVMLSNHFYLLPELEGEPIGFFLFHPTKSDGVYEGHTALLSRYWGEREITTQAGVKALNWMFEHTDAHRIVGRAALELTQAHGFVKRIGMREIGADAHNRYYEISK